MAIYHARAIWWNRIVKNTQCKLPLLAELEKVIFAQWRPQLAQLALLESKGVPMSL